MPLDGADNRYGQLYKPIQSHPFSDAGIKGFEPIQPFKLPSNDNDPSSNFLAAGNIQDFHWPTLSELNDEFSPFPWTNDSERDHVLGGNSCATVPILYNGPAPPAPQAGSRGLPSPETILAGIVQSMDKLFLIAHSIGTNHAKEWRLVRVSFEDSLRLRPSCLQDGRFLLDFYILHPSDVRYNATNQRYWLQYHPIGQLTTPMTSVEAHLIRPSDTSEAHAARKKLVPFRRWANLTHENTYIHGPFDFASIRGQKSRDRLPQAAWDALASCTSMFQNEVPRADLPTYSIHVDRGIHLTFSSEAITSQVQLAFSESQNSGDDLYML